MKNILLNILVLVAICLVSCEQDLSPQNNEVKDKYGYIKFKDTVDHSFEFYDQNNSKFSLILEYVGSADLQSYNWYIQHKKMNGELGEKVLYESLDPSTSIVFTPGANVSTTFDLKKVNSVLMPLSNNIEIGDSFLFSSELEYNDGLKVNEENISNYIDTSMIKDVFFDFECVLRSGLDGELIVRSIGTYCDQEWQDINDEWHTVKEWREKINNDNHQIAEWTEVAPLVFEVEGEFSYLSFELCQQHYYVYARDLKIVISDNKIYPEGMDTYGNTYKFPKVKVDDDLLTLTITNTDNDSSRIELKRTDGINWPQLESL